MSRSTSQCGIQGCHHNRSCHPLFVPEILLMPRHRATIFSLWEHIKTYATAALSTLHSSESRLCWKYWWIILLASVCLLSCVAHSPLQFIFFSLNGNMRGVASSRWEWVRIEWWWKSEEMPRWWRKSWNAETMLILVTWELNEFKIPKKQTKPTEISCLYDPGPMANEAVLMIDSIAKLELSPIL